MGVPRPGKGTKLEVEIAEVMTKVSNVLSVGEHGEEQEEYQWHDIEAGAVRRRGTGVADGGEIEIAVNWNSESASQQFLRQCVRSPLPQTFQITYGPLDPDDEEEPAVVEEFDAVVKSFKKDEITSAERVTGKILLGLDGVPDLGDD